MGLIVAEAQPPVICVARAEYRQLRKQPWLPSRVYIIPTNSAQSPSRMLKRLDRRLADVPLFVEHCEAVAAEIDVKLRWLGEQARRGLSVWSGALPVRHVMLEVACEPSIVGSL